MCFEHNREEVQACGCAFALCVQVRFFLLGVLSRHSRRVETPVTRKYHRPQDRHLMMQTPIALLVTILLRLSIFLNLTGSLRPSGSGKR